MINRGRDAVALSIRLNLDRLPAGIGWSPSVD
jgi:hypothetical protein